MELLENGLQLHSGVTPLFSMRALSLASSQSCHSIVSDAWCKRALKIGMRLIVVQVPTGAVPAVVAVPPRHVRGEARERVEEAVGDQHVVVAARDERHEEHCPSDSYNTRIELF